MKVPAPNHRIGVMPNPNRISDNGSSAAKMYAALDADYIAERNRRRFEYVLSHLTMKQHELFSLMSANLTQGEIATELGVSQSAVSQLQKVLLKKIKKILENTYTPPSISRYSGRR